MYLKKDEWCRIYCKNHIKSDNPLKNVITHYQSGRE